MDFNQCVDITVTSFFDKYEHKCTNELATLAYFHLFFFDILKNNLKKVNFALKRTTVISNHIDKSPIIEVKNRIYNFNCELGDLLLIIEKDKKKKAILIQAKQNTTSYTQGSTLKEKKLYENWPPFKIIKPQLLNNHIFKIKSKTDSISRFLTFFGQNEKLMIGNAINQDIKFSTFLHSFIYNKHNVGRQFNNLRSLKLHNFKRLLNGLNKNFLDDWDSLIETVKKYIDGRYFTNKDLNTHLNRKQVISNICFQTDDLYNAELDIDTILENLSKNVENEVDMFSFFSIIEISCISANSCSKNL